MIAKQEIEDARRTADELRAHNHKLKQVPLWPSLLPAWHYLLRLFYASYLLRLFNTNKVRFFFFYEATFTSLKSLIFYHEVPFSQFDPWIFVFCFFFER